MRVLTVLVLLVSIGVSSVAQTGAMVTATGQATINGKPASESAALSSGDRITTGGESSANLTLNGAMALVAANSSAVYDGTALALENGVVAVNSTTAFVVRAGNVTITPQGRSRYEVSRSACNITITVRDGSVTLPDNTKISAGNSLTRTDGTCAAGAIPPPTPGVAGAGTLTTAAIATAAVAAAAAGTAAYISIRKPTSPSRP